jgi:hypothetical protein
LIKQFCLILKEKEKVQNQKKLCIKSLLNLQLTTNEEKNIIAFFKVNLDI